jgi:transcription antitermination factor NusG
MGNVPGTRVCAVSLRRYPTVSDMPAVTPEWNDLSEYLENPWHVLHVRSRHEKSVHAQFEAKGLNGFLPLCTVPHKWADRWKTVSVPLFPGYVFCRFDIAQRSNVLATSGVIDFVRTGRELGVIDPSEIDAINLAVGSGLATEPYRGFVRGNRVVMSHGPLQGLMGTLMEVRSGYRLVISVQLLCRSVLVEINRDWVVPCSNELSVLPTQSPLS